MEINSMEELDADTILACWKLDNKIKYLVSWKVFRTKHNSWEPRTVLDNCVEPIYDFGIRLSDATTQHQRTRGKN